MKTLVKRKRRTSKFETIRMTQILHPNPAAVTLTASGFGDARCNGSATAVDTFTGKPLYAISGGAYLFNDGVSWRIQADDPRIVLTDSLYSHGDVSELGEYLPYMGTPPSGVVSS